MSNIVWIVNFKVIYPEIPTVEQEPMKTGQN